MFYVSFLCPFNAIVNQTTNQIHAHVHLAQIIVNSLYFEMTMLSSHNIPNYTKKKKAMPSPKHGAIMPGFRYY